MFTGLIADLGAVRDVRSDVAGATLEVDTVLASQLAEGDSIAVNGVCLTATAIDERGFCAQAMLETLRRTSLAAIEPGARVNLELPLRPDGRLGGHIVQGHVDGTATVASLREDGFARLLELELDTGAGTLDGNAERRREGGGERLARYLVEKGSVALDGVSLTVSGLCGDRGFSVSLIPETLQRTNLGSVRVGDLVNVEVDVLAKHVERLMNTEAAA